LKLYDLRNALEHRYLKIHDSLLHQNENSMDTLAHSVDLINFQSATLELMRYSREAIVLLSLLVNVEERQRLVVRRESSTVQVTMDEYKDEWKTF